MSLLHWLFTFLFIFLLTELEKNFLGSKLEMNLKFMTFRDPDRLYFIYIVYLLYIIVNLTSEVLIN